MSAEFDLLKEIASKIGYRFEVLADGTERVYRPDGTLAMEAKKEGEPHKLPNAKPSNPPPDDVYQSADGFWYRHFTLPSGILGAQRVCEDCWQNMPPYANAKLGFVSPESEGKYTQATIVGEFCRTSGKMPLQKAVCRECLFAAFGRVYPGAPLPDLSSELREDQNNTMEWSATNVAPTLIHLDVDDPMRRVN